MNPTKPQRIVLVVLALLTAAAWALIAWLAIAVTETIVAMLEYVVELAQLY